MEEKRNEKFKEVSLDETFDGSMADTEDDYKDDSKNDVEKRKKKLKKKLKKKVYFRSDFVGEPETSSSEDEEKNEAPKINTADLSWLMWLWYYIVFASKSTFHAAEFCGEKLADLFGITAPKYQYAIAEYYRLKQEEEDEEDAERREAEYANGQNKSSLVKMDKENEANIV